MKRKAKKVVKTEKKINVRPPVVAVLGHVDHGKTSLLDKIRQTDVASGEFGGITQKIGASRVFLDKEKKKWITFIDTPGHEAFSKMRARGGKAADLAILVVAANDSVMPQTIESIAHIKDAKIPFIVAVNKIDVEGANVAKVKRDLAKQGVLVEGMGGEVVVVEVSAKIGQGIKELLDMISLVWEMSGVEGEPKSDFNGIVIESGIDKGKGSYATILVKKGTLRIGDEVNVDNEKVRIRAMINDRGERLKEVEPSIAVEVLGFNKPPMVGGEVVKNEKIKMKDEKIEKGKEEKREITLEDLFRVEKKKLRIVLKADTVGSLEAVVGGITDNVEILSRGIGEINEADVMLAKTGRAIVIGFNVEPTKNAEKLAKLEKILVTSYKIIYKLFEELEDAAIIFGKEKKTEDILGKAEVIADFSNPSHRIAGAKLLEGRIAKRDKIRITRKGEVVGMTGIESLRRAKDVVDKVDKGQEFGAIFNTEIDFKIGDMIISVRQIKS